MLAKNDDYQNYPTPQSHQPINNPNPEPHKKNGVSGLEVLFWCGLSAFAIHKGVKYYNKKKGKKNLEEARSEEGIDFKHYKDINDFQTDEDINQHIENSTKDISSNFADLYSGKSGTLITNQSRYPDSTTFPILGTHNMKLEKIISKKEKLTTSKLDKNCKNKCKVRNKNNGSANKATSKNDWMVTYINAKNPKK